MAAETPASKESKAVASLQKSIEHQKHKITDVELKHSTNKVATLSKLKEIFDMLIKFTNKESTLHEDCQKELQQMKVVNSSMSNDMECIKKEVEQMSKELEESKIIKEKLKQITKELQDSKSLNDLQQKNFTEEIRKNLMQISSLQLAAMKQQNEHKSVLKLVEDLKDKNEKLNAKIVELEKPPNLLQESEDFNQSLIIKESESNDELQKARKRMIEGIVDRSIRNGNIGVKRMGELDTKSFLKAFRAKMKYNKEEAEQRALEVCSIWEKYLYDPQWHPFKRITVDGEPQEEIVCDDEKLKQLRKEVSFEAQWAVVQAWKEMNDHNPSGRFVVSELWNHGMKRKATLEEGVEFLLSQWKTKKRKIHQTGTDDGENADSGNAASLHVGKGK